MRRWKWLVAGLAAWAAVACSTARGATLPTGFVEHSVSGLSDPTAMDLAPDGRLFVAEQGGRCGSSRTGRSSPRRSSP